MYLALFLIAEDKIVTYSWLYIKNGFICVFFYAILIFLLPTYYIFNDLSYIEVPMTLCFNCENSFYPLEANLLNTYGYNAY
ncbi:hypothetical protein SEEH5757_16921 [Salmonella enterica subsp. enterica serovar Heidelberg str. N15757]|nr:hypothetical protein SEEH5757_16921 [Salmonella enterica subsp. enterica serovar Heidelberg str. N15757]